MPTTFSLYDLYWVIGEQRLGPLESYFADALAKNGKKVTYINIHDFSTGAAGRLSVYSHRLPRKYDNALQRKYFSAINTKLLQRFEKEKPSHIFIYNDCKILPSTIDYFKKHGSKVIIFLGDDPNYLFPAKKTFLLNVMKADRVIVPDTGWMEGLKMLDVNDIIFSPVGTNTDVYFPVTPNSEQLGKYSAQILFAGTGYYLNSWGIKRAAVLNELAGFDMKIFGDSQWLETLEYFPDLRKHFINNPLPAAEVNIACSCAKIYPVTVNAGVVNGVSTRVFDCAASGIFVLAEYKKDFDMLFPGNEIACFKSKSELRDKAAYYLSHPDEAKSMAEAARKVVLEKYDLKFLIGNILEQI